MCMCVCVCVCLSSLCAAIFLNHIHLNWLDSWNDLEYVITWLTHHLGHSERPGRRGEERRGEERRGGEGRGGEGRGGEGRGGEGRGGEGLKLKHPCSDLPYTSCKLWT